MYVVLENYLQMVCDYPAAYEGEQCFDFIKEVPTTWDETKVIDAKVGEYISVARRNGDDWYVGTITNHEAREVKIPLHFLGEGDYFAEIYKDADDSNETPNHLIIQKANVTNKEVLSMKVASGGGLAIRLKRK